MKEEPMVFFSVNDGNGNSNPRSAPIVERLSTIRIFGQLCADTLVSVESAESAKYRGPKTVAVLDTPSAGVNRFRITRNNGSIVATLPRWARGARWIVEIGASGKPRDVRQIAGELRVEMQKELRNSFPEQRRGSYFA